MKYKNHIRTTAIFLALLIISLPIIFAEEFSRTYDANGNLISDGKYYREYNGLNQLVRVRLGNISTSPVLEEYRWHPIEERIVIKKVFSNDVLNYTIYYPNENYVYIVNSSGSYSEKYIYQDGTLVAQVNSDGQKQAIHSDHEGSNTLITAADGSVVENTFYSPYGEIISGGKNSRYGYEGKEYDSLTEDIDFKSRKYEPDIPIYGKPDILIENPYDPQYLNRYLFERGNPLNKIDPTGHQTGIAEWAIGIAIVTTLIDVSVLVNYGTLIKINEDPNLETELINIQQKEGEGLIGSYLIEKGIEKIFGLLYGTTAGVTMTVSGVQTFNNYNQKVALANPFRYKDYLDRLASNRQFGNEAERTQFYTQGGVNLLSLTSSLSLFNRYGGSNDIKSDMQRTATSGLNIRWYYNPDTGIYTWRVGDTKPEGYVDSGSSGSGGSSGGSSSGGGIEIPCNLNCGKLLW